MGALLIGTAVTIPALELLLDWREAFGPTTWSNWLLGIVGTTGVVIGMRTLRALVRQTQANELSAQAAKTSADALINSERAWVMVEIKRRPGEMFVADIDSVEGGQQRKSTGAIVTCVCSNQGKTPARVSEKRICLFVTNIMKPLPKTPNLDIEVVDAEPHYLQSGEQSTHEWKIFGEGKRAIGNMAVIYGVVRYRHIFSEKEAQTTFGFRIAEDGKLERLSEYPAYNENT
jgi:hypothetical protein